MRYNIILENEVLYGWEDNCCRTESRELLDPGDGREYNGMLPYLLYSIGALYYSALLFINIYCTVLYLQVGTVLYCTVLYLELGKSTTVLLSR